MQDSSRYFYIILPKEDVGIFFSINFSKFIVNKFFFQFLYESMSLYGIFISSGFDPQYRQFAILLSVYFRPQNNGEGLYFALSVRERFMQFTKFQK